MARTVAQGFDEFLSGMTPTPTQFSAASRHRAAVEARLDAVFGMYRSFETGRSTVRRPSQSGRLSVRANLAESGHNLADDLAESGPTLRADAAARENAGRTAPSGGQGEVAAAQ